MHRLPRTIVCHLVKLTVSDDHQFAMPQYLRWISYSALGATALTILVIVFGPQEGLETLAGGLLAYFTLLYHIAIGPIFLVHGIRAQKLSFGYLLMMCYLIGIWGLGLYQFVVINDIDDAVLDLYEAQTDPQSHRVRDLGAQLYRQYKFSGQIPAHEKAEWHGLALQASNVNRRDEKRKAPLWYAAAMGDTEMVTRLLNAGADTDNTSLYYTTPLAAAIEEGHVETAQRLLDAGADPDAGLNKHYPSLSLATRNENVPMIETLIRGGADVNLGDPAPFAIALRKGRSDIASILLDAGAEATVAYHNKLPIEVALEQDDEAMIQVLLKKTDGFEARTDSRDPLLFQLVERCNVDDFERFLQLSADPNIQNNKGLGIFSRVILLRLRRCDLDAVRSEFARALIEAGADINQVNERNESLLLLSLRHGRPKIARLLVEHGVQLNGEIANKDFLMLAASLGANDLVGVAIKHGFDLNRWSGGFNKSNALYEAARAGHVKTVQLMLEKGARLPTEDVNRRNLFRFAADHPEVLTLLLDLYAQGPRDRKFDLAIKSSVMSSKNESSMALLSDYDIN